LAVIFGTKPERFKIIFYGVKNHPFWQFKKRRTVISGSENPLGFYSDFAASIRFPRRGNLFTRTISPHFIDYRDVFFDG
jgi:hypothetical protein